GGLAGVGVSEFNRAPNPVRTDRMPRDLDTLSRHPLKRYAWCFLPLRFPPRPQASGKSPQFPTPVFPHRKDDTRARFAGRQPLKTPPILVSHRLREPIVQWATLAYPPL